MALSYLLVHHKTALLNRHFYNFQNTATEFRIVLKIFVTETDGEY